jgi:exonuclease III
MDLTDIYRNVYPNTKEYSVFSAAHRTFLKIDHILGHKTLFNRYKKTRRIPCILSDHHRESWISSTAETTENVQSPGK